jgi:Flp pilus assembly protein TadD
MKNQLKHEKKDLEPQRLELKTLLECFQNKQYDDAEKLALSLTKRFKKHPFGWKVLGAVFNQTGRLTEGLDACQKSVELDPNNAENHNNLGNVLYKLGQLEDAEKSYKKVIELKPGNADAHNSLGNILHKCGRLDEAEKNYRKSITLKPDFAIAYNNLGVIFKKLGKKKAAIKSFKKAINLKPNFNAALINKGQLLFENNKFKKALIEFNLCDTKKSRSLTLSSLYALGRIDDIYKVIKREPEIDDTNLRIAAFAAFIANIEKKDTANNFCKNPLEFIHTSNISNHINDSNLFIHELIKELSYIKTSWEPYNKSTLGGFQSRINLFENPLEQMSILKSIITKELDTYYSKFKDESCVYIQKWPSKKKLTGWHVILKKQGNQKVHIHPSGWLSGVIYLKVVPSLGQNEGAIEFGLNGKRYSHSDSPKIIHRPALGDIVFFPSSLHHRTIPFSTEMDRIIVSFDLLPK